MKRERTGSRVPYRLFVIVFAMLSLMPARARAYPQAPGDDAASQKVKNFDDVKHDTPGVAINNARPIITAQMRFIRTSFISWPGQPQLLSAGSGHP